MEFEWDNGKNHMIRTKRGFGFDYVARVFKDPQRIEVPDNRHEYDEQRFIVYGLIEGRVFVVVYTLRNTRCRIITAWKANEREIGYYVNNQNQG